ncbi:MAG TPA: hypothetical protein VF814_05995 [Casimicrobiaceae bacterium]
MNMTRTALPLALAAMLAGGAFAQTTGSTVQRNVKEQERIEQGLQGGSLNTREAARLEKQEAAVDRMQSNALKDGSLSNAEKARLQRTQNRVSRDIYRHKHDAQVGSPNSASSRRMQADVQRDVNQQARIAQGVQSGALTNRETANLERGQARVNRREARAGADGRVGPLEQPRVQARENAQSGRIFRKKHNGVPKS